MFNINTPLAERLRPENLEEYIGQQHLVGAKSIIKKSIDAGTIPSIILWGPPGVGKTTLAYIIAKHIKAEFYTLSAISAGVKEVREILEKAKFHTRTLLFIDEIHRFNKSQQDALLGAVEKGTITLIGATTENPSFEVISALLSRCQVYTLHPLSTNELNELLYSAIKKDKFLIGKKVELVETEALLRLSGGDARKLLNLLELVVTDLDVPAIVFDKNVLEVAHRKIAMYDKNGEVHYDVVSAFIKSIRGSDPNAAIYWLARMIEGGEDVKFIARRLLILASEDIGNANPTALVIANECFQAVNVIGYPESDIILAQCVTYLATSTKSNSSYKAIKAAKALVRQSGDLSVPIHLRNAPTKLMKDEGYGKDYIYVHDYDQNFSKQEYLPQEISGTKFFEPGANAREKEMRDKLRSLWEDKYNY